MEEIPDNTLFIEIDCLECKKPLIILGNHGQMDILCGHCRMYYSVVVKDKSEESGDAT